VKRCPTSSVSLEMDIKATEKGGGREVGWRKVG
jgi:hypothetical protein